MMILVAALEPVKQVIFSERQWDRRGKKHIEMFILRCKRTLKMLMEDLELLEMYKETKAVFDESIDDKFIVDAIAVALTEEPIKKEDPKPDAPKGKGKKGAETKPKGPDLTEQQKLIDRLQPEGRDKILDCKQKSTRKLLHLDFIFKLYMPLWCLEIGHKGDYISYQEMKEAENSIKKMKILEQIGKKSFLTTRQYEKFQEFFNATRVITRVF